MKRSRPIRWGRACGIAIVLALAAGFPIAAAADARLPPHTRTSYPYGYYAYDPCYRYGRCTADEMSRLREHIQRADRVAPQAPEARVRAPAPFRVDVEPTPESQIQPEYREASRLREEYRGAPAPARP